MLYPIYVHVGDEGHAHGVTIPDFPGCFSGADDWDDLPRMVQEAIELYCEGEDLEIPSPSSLDDLRQDPEYEGGEWVFIDVDLAKLDTRQARLPLSVPVGALKVIDQYAAEQGATRSGFMVKASLAAARVG